MGFFMRLKSKIRSQEEDRLTGRDSSNGFSQDLTAVTKQHGLSRTGSVVGATIARVRSNSRSNARDPSPAVRKVPTVLAPLPAQSRRDMRPTGLFADVKPPLLGAAPRLEQSHRPRRKRSDGSTSEKNSYPFLEGERGRRRVPNDDKANKVLGRDPDPAIWYNKQLNNLQVQQQCDINRSWSAVAPRNATSDAARKPRTSRRNPKPTAFELPGSFPDVIEKQAISSSCESSLIDGHDHEVDSAIELPTEHNITRASSFSFAAELEGSEVSSVPPLVELPGSTPMVAEVDAGPLPPCELPGSYTYDEKKAPSFDLPVRRSHIIAQKLSMPILSTARMVY